MKLSMQTVGIVIAVAIFALAAVILFRMPEPAHAGVAPQSPALGTATTSTKFSVTTNTLVLGTTTNPLNPSGGNYLRDFASICTASGTPVALNMDNGKPTDASTGAPTVWIAAAAGYNACYEITDRNLYFGAVTASSTAGATSVTVKDYVH